MSESLKQFHPSALTWEDSQLAKWMHEHGLEKLEDLHHAVEQDPAWFWGEVEKTLGITWLEPYRQVLDVSRGERWAKWYVGGRLNLSIDAVDKHAKGGSASKYAVYWEGDNGETAFWTYGQLLQEVNRFANGLKALGLGKGDRVAMYLPMIPETVVVLLGTARIGAIVIPCFSGYGGEAVAARIQDSEASVVVTADAFYRRGKSVEMLKEARLAAEISPSVEAMVVVNRAGTYQRPESAQRWKEVDYREWNAAQSDDCPAESMDSEDPFMLIYTSGTTGKPKGTVHVHGGFPIKAAQDLMHGFDFRRDDTLFWVTDMGWMMGPWMVYGALLLGGTVVIFEGTPDYPNPDRLWSLVEKYKVSHLGVSPTAIRSLMTKGMAWVDQHDLSSLKAFGSTGEPWNPEPWRWLFEKVGKGRVPILNYSGGTEIAGGILGCLPGLPLKPCSFTGAIPGMVVDIVDEEGRSVRGEVGELVIRRPWPGMTRGFWRNPQRYEETYWSRWPHLWVHGDWAKVDQEGFWFIEGRSDDTLKIAGKRVGPAEIESILVSHEQVMEAAAVGVPDELKGTAAVCFVVLVREKPEQTAPLSEAAAQLSEALKDLVAERLGKPLRPKAIHIVPELPHTRNGKILRRVIQAAYIGKAAGDLSSLENLHAVDFIKQLAGERS
jgi:acetyl-CoA synthetase